VAAVPRGTSYTPTTRGCANLGVKSPRSSDAKGGIFAVLPTLSFESKASTASDSANALLELNPEGDLPKRIQRIEAKLGKIKIAWPRPFADLEASYLGVVSDIKTLEHRRTSLCHLVGNPLPDSNPISEQLHKLSASLKQLEGHLEVLSSEWESSLHCEIGMLEHHLQEVQTKVQTLDSVLQQLSSKSDLHERRFNHIKPMLTTLFANKDRGSTVELLDIQTQFAALESKLSRSASHQHHDSSPTEWQQQMFSVEADLKDQAHLISLLENRLVGAGVKMGDLIFQSFEDLLSWTKTKLPGGRFGFIVDGHSFLEFFPLSSHIDSELSAAAEHNAEKAGYATY